MAEASSIRPQSSANIEQWHFEADVVVAGYGIAGVSASIEAARAGADVLVLERTSGWGGAAALAGGFIYLAAGPRCSRHSGSRTPPPT